MTATAISSLGEMTEVTEKAKRRAFTVTPTGIDRHFQTHARVMNNSVAMQAAAMKRKEFDLEDEWRLMVSYLDVRPIERQLKLGASASGFIVKTYDELPIKATEIEEIIVGPNVSALNIRAVEIMLQNLGHGWRNIGVRRGDIALRALRVRADISQTPSQMTIGQLTSVAARLDVGTCRGHEASKWR